MPRNGDMVFQFGKNWQRFLDVLNDERIEEAEQSLADMLELEDLKGLDLVDVGSGSGLFSLAARRRGASVLSFDVDKESVACTSVLRDRYFPDDPNWRVQTGSVLDEAYLQNLGAFDVVYSWGVLHHTGDMWQALANVDRLVRPGGLLFIAIYNDLGRATRQWAWVKRTYVRLPRPARFLVLAPAFLRLWGFRFFADALRGNPWRTWHDYATQRGMSPWHDVVDWVGGYPYEASRPDAIFDFFRGRGYSLRRLVTRGGIGCNEFVFKKTVDDLG